MYHFNVLFCSTKSYIDELVQEGRNSSALAMELRPSCTNSSIWESQIPVLNSGHVQGAKDQMHNCTPYVPLLIVISKQLIASIQDLATWWNASQGNITGPLWGESISHLLIIFNISSSLPGYRTLERDGMSERLDSRITWYGHTETLLQYWPSVRGNHWSLVDSPHKGSVM